MYLASAAFAVLCLASLTTCLAAANRRSEAELRRLRHVMENLCPGANVCSGENSTQDMNADLFPSGYTTCCAACSCADNCEDTGDCCFPDPQRQPGDAKDTECTFNRLPVPNKAGYHQFSSFYMISKPPDGGCIRLQNTRPKTGSETVLRNALSPVSSNISGIIYRNMYLAQCHGENDVIPWNAMLHCNSMDDVANNRNLFDMAAHTEAILSLARRPTHCEIRFKYPGNKSDLDGKHCYKNAKNTCTSRNFALPVDVNWSRDEIIDECQNGGLYSPYHRRANYANVFCHICNSESFSKFNVCLKDRERGVLTSMFTSLLNFDLYGKELALSLTTPKTGMRRACPRDSFHSDECRTIHCPSGQLTSNDGSCVWLFESMGDMLFHIVLRLVPTQPISLPNFDITEIARQLSSPWPETWEVREMYYETEHFKNPDVRQIFVRQTVNGSGTKLEAMLQHIDEFMPKRWSAPFGMFEQSFAGFTDMDRTSMAVVVDREPGQTTVVTRSLSRVTPFQIRKPAAFFYITQMFFCRQVELVDHEYTLDARQYMLTYKRTNTTFPEAEFASVGRTNGGSSIRICIEDSGLYYVGGNAGAGLEKRSMVWVVVMLWWSSAVVAF